jgi:aryl-alcohol dehydrogenase-like predicted oxidoreductase
MPALAATGLDVYPLCLGANVFGWTADEEASFAILDRYAEAGGNYIDPADVYSSWVPGHQGGESEATIGRWIAGRKARVDELTIATKVGAHGGAGLGDLRPDTIRTACDASLRRLNLERIDLYYQHRDDTDVPLEESLGTFSELVQEGKIAHVGVSNVSADRLREMLAVTEREGYAPIVALQPKYNLLDREGFEEELQEVCAEHEIACVPFYGLAMGFLTGKYARDTDAATAGTPRAKGAMKMYGRQERAWKTLDLLRELGSGYGVPIAAIALAWLAARDTVVAPIASATSTQQLDELLHMATLELSDEHVAALDEVSAG